MPSRPMSRAALAGTLSLGLTAAVASAPAASAAPTPTPTVTVHTFATGNSTRFGPDDLTMLGKHIFVAWQNGVGPDGSPSTAGVTHSTLVEYDTTGATVHEWPIIGHVDGIAAYGAADEVVVTTNEDANSLLLTVNPNGPSGSQVTHYQYMPKPLPHGGGTDAVSVYQGTILVTASNPTKGTNVPAVYKVTLQGGIAQTTHVFFDDSSATVKNQNASDYGHSVQLGLTDPDSNAVVPGASPRFAHDFVLDSQGDEQQIYVHQPTGATPELSLLRLTQSVDDTAWVTSTTGTLYVTDSVDNSVFAVQGSWPRGTALAAVTPANANNPVNAPNYLGSLDLFTGAISPVLTTVQAKGLLFVP